MKLSKYYVSREIAEKLVEQGYPQNIEEGVICRLQNKWNKNYESTRKITEYDINNPLTIYNETYPTLHSVQNWLREEKKTHITVDLDLNGYYARLYDVTRRVCTKVLVSCNEDTYEVALSKAILEAVR